MSFLFATILFSIKFLKNDKTKNIVQNHIYARVFCFVELVLKKTIWIKHEKLKYVSSS